MADIPRRLFVAALILKVSVLSSADIAASSVHHPPTKSFVRSLDFPEAVVSDINNIYIPFTLVGQLIVVQARVDTVAGNFIVDTGAERLVLNQRYFPRIHHYSIASVGNTGPVSKAAWRTVDSLHVEQLKIYDLRAHLVDLQHIELKKNTRVVGILGYHVFASFEVFIDFQNRVIGLSRVDRNGLRLDRAPRWEVPSDSLDFVMKKHFIIVDATVDDRRFQMILDSGAELNLLDRRVHRKVLDNFTILKRVNLVGVGRREVEVLAGVLRDLSCGNQHCPSMNTLLTSMDEINDTFGASAHGVLGYEFLSTRRVMINYQKEKLYFFKPIRP